MPDLLVLKPAAAAVALAVLWFAEAVAPLVEREERARHRAANLALAALNAVAGALLFAAATLWVTERARAAGFGLLHAWDGPPLAETLAGLVLFDAWMYAWHRLNHAVPLLWRFHAVHHADAEMDATSGLRFHTGEIVLSSLARLAVLPLLGLSVGQVLLYEAVLLPVILFHHANVRLPPRADRLLRLVVVTPGMHWVHHSPLQPETDSNFASVLSVWDRLFGTYRRRAEGASVAVGLHGYETHEWRTLRGMLAAPFRPRARRDDVRD
jgi:sterol desaturase/sphingolipid hydroxylase (fatty acid hydroxylase superfamily)